MTEEAKKKPKTNDLVKMLYGGIVTIENFNYDTLSAPPISQFLFQQDIDYLRTEVSTSIALSGKPRKKYEIMDFVMKQRGFVRLAGGTNRLVYRHYEVPSIVVKVAFDEEGMRSNIAEFKNQNLIKPYCCKVFEVSPCGTIGLFERVDRITSRYEFASIAEDVYEMITHVLVGRYVVNDIGTNFMYNWGVRVGFGPVLLDFPYIFKLDGAKIICKDRLEDGSICNGEIDYDGGFNFLKCKKCGKPYFARDLAKPDSESGLFVSAKRGEINMKVAYVKGETVVNVVDKGEATAFMKVPKKIVRDNKIDPNNIRSIPVCVGSRGRKAVTAPAQEQVAPKHKEDYGKFVGKRVETSIPSNPQPARSIYEKLGIVTETLEDVKERDTHHYDHGEKEIVTIPVTRMVSYRENVKTIPEEKTDDRNDVSETQDQDLPKTSAIEHWEIKEYQPTHAKVTILDKNDDQVEVAKESINQFNEKVQSGEPVSQEETKEMLESQKEVSLSYHPEVLEAINTHGMKPVVDQITRREDGSVIINAHVPMSDSMEISEEIVPQIDKSYSEDNTEDNVEEETDYNTSVTTEESTDSEPSELNASEEHTEEAKPDYGIRITPANKVRENLEMKAQKRSMRFDPAFYDTQKKR